MALFTCAVFLVYVGLLILGVIQTNHLTVSADAAKKSADAARDALLAQRAHVFPDDFQWEQPRTYSVSFAINNVGATPGKIVEAVVCTLVLTDDPPSTPDYDVPTKQEIPAVYAYPGKSPRAAIDLTGDETVKLWDAFHEKTATQYYLLVYGRIVYRDSWGTVHQTGWSRTWYGGAFVQGEAPPAYDYAD